MGGLLGSICFVFVEAVLNNSLQFSAVPLASILEAAAFLIAFCLTATVIPLRSIAKEDSVKLIITIE